LKYYFTLLISVFIFGCNGESSGDASADSFGDAITFENITSLSDILALKDENIGLEFLTEGIAIEICQKKGCWMDIKDGEDVMTVRFKDYSFFMPKDGAGRKATIQGIFTKETYEDTDEQGNAIIQEYYQIIASGVKLQKSLQN